MKWPETEVGIKNRNDVECIFNPFKGKMIMPGDQVEMVVELGNPFLMSGQEVAVEEGLRFTVREGGKTVGTGNSHKTNECIRSCD